MLTKRIRYIAAYERAEVNLENDTDLYSGIPNTDPSFSALVRKGPSVEACAVNDFIKGRFCPPKSKAA